MQHDTAKQPLPRSLAIIERGVGILVSLACGVVLAIGVAVVFAGVIFRYFLSNPLQWTNEVAISTLIAVTFLGGALALYRREHVSVEAVRSLFTGFWAELVDGLVRWVVLAVSVGLAWSSVPYLLGVLGQTTTSGELPESIFVYPLLVGGITMSFFALMNLLRTPWRALLPSTIIAVAVAAIIAAAGAWIVFDVVTVIWLMVAAIVVCLLIGVPVGFSLGAGGLTYIFLTGALPFVQFALEMESGAQSFVLLAIPFFVLAGLVMEVNGMSRRLVDFLHLVLGGIRGGLSLVLIASMAVFSGISGSKSADVVAIGSVMLPAMKDMGYDEDDSVALLSATAVMGETIPPCINMIILGYVANVSIGGLFVAGLLPAAVMAAALGVVAVWAARRMIAPGKVSANLHSQPPAKILKTFGGALSAFVMIGVIFGGIVGGIATPTEVSSFAVVYALVVGLVLFREMSWRSFGHFWMRSASMAGMILFIVASAQLLTYILTINGVPQSMAVALTGVAASWGTWAFLILSILMLIVMGSVLEGAPALIIFGPLLLPAARDLGVAPLHFGILLIISMGLGLFAPPLGVGLYTACVVGGRPMEGVARPILKYLGIILVMLFVIAFVPAITLWLPSL